MGKPLPTIESRRDHRIRHMIIGLAVLSIGAHGLIIVSIAIAGWMSRCS